MCVQCQQCLQRVVMMAVARRAGGARIDIKHEELEALRGACFSETRRNIYIRSMSALSEPNGIPHMYSAGTVTDTDQTSYRAQL